MTLYSEQHGAGEPLVLVHGLIATGAMFEPVLADFARAHRVIVPDLRGHGRSADLPGPYTVQQLAADVAGLLGELGVEPADVLGYSHGGAVAQQLAHDHPQRVRRLVLACTYAFNLVTPRERIEGLLAPWMVRLLGTRGVARLIARPGIGGGTPLTPEGARWLQNIIASNRTATMVAATRGMATFDSRRWLGELRCPTLVIYGTEDKGVPPHHARMLADGIPGAQLVGVRGAGHTLIWTHTAELVKVAEEFLASPA